MHLQSILSLFNCVQWLLLLLLLLILYRHPKLLRREWKAAFVGLGSKENHKSTQRHPTIRIDNLSLASLSLKATNFSKAEINNLHTHYLHNDYSNMVYNNHETVFEQQDQHTLKQITTVTRKLKDGADCV